MSTRPPADDGRTAEGEAGEPLPLTTVEPRTIYIVATPIGNLGDVTRRTREVLRQVTLVAAEDTRHTRKLLTHLAVRAQLVSLHAHNEVQMTRRLIDDLRRGHSVALVSDAGMPLISDPGLLLIRAAIDAGIHVTAVPGPSAVTTALAVAGLPASSFIFLGFAPRKPGRLRKLLAAHVESPPTLVLFQPARHVDALLESALITLGNRSAALCVELTKRFEDVRRGTLADLLEGVRSQPLRGEVTVVIAGTGYRPQRSRPGS